MTWRREEVDASTIRLDPTASGPNAHTFRAVATGHLAPHQPTHQAGLPATTSHGSPVSPPHHPRMRSGARCRGEVSPHVRQEMRGRGRGGTREGGRGRGRNPTAREKAGEHHRKVLGTSLRWSWERDRGRGGIRARWRGKGRGRYPSARERASARAKTSSCGVMTLWSMACVTSLPRGSARIESHESSSGDRDVQSCTPTTTHPVSQILGLRASHQHLQLRCS